MNRTGRRAKLAAMKKSNEPVASVLICVPTHGPQWYSKFAMDLIAMRDDALALATPGWRIDRVGVDVNTGSILTNQRTWLLEAAQNGKFTHALFVDTDQTFPRFTLRKLLSAKQPIVACNVATKQIPSIPTARKLVDGEPQPVFTLQTSSGLEEVWRVGTGIMLIELSVLDKIEKPWFLSNPDPSVHRHGEDWYFVQKLHDAGVPIYIDHDVSKQVGHLGIFEYHHGHVPPELIEEALRDSEERMDLLVAG